MRMTDPSSRLTVLIPIAQQLLVECFGQIPELQGAQYFTA